MLVFLIVVINGRYSFASEPTLGGFVKPEGFLMLNSKFATTRTISNAKIRVSLEGIMDSNLKDYTYLTNFNGTVFDGSTIRLHMDGVEISECNKVTCDHSSNVIDCDSNTYIYDSEKKEIVIHKTALPQKNDYTIKMTIPTKRNISSGKTTKVYNTQIVEMGLTYPLKIDIIENKPLLEGGVEELVKYSINYKIKPYKMPRIN